MLLNKITPIYLILICLSFMALQGPPRNDFDKNFPYGSVFKSVKCETFENNTYGYMRNCSVKAYSKKFVALNLGYTLTRPLNKPIYARIIMKYRYGNIYRDIYNLTVEICSLFESIDSQPLLQNLIAPVKKSIGNHLHKCPYTIGDDITNLTLDETENKSIFMLPEGYYKICITFQKSVQKQIARFCAVFYTKSPMKESFGK
ncbi:unnamed protein product [Chironomus riparius]|uniref:Uncharacterized protein n=1 Tax=Chironomus riparius TaxID=315576 RepID=A0A9N9S596_9DIPT|nr:unnamed protein product [Chironomus riparius]